MHRRSFVAGMGATGLGGLWLPAAARAEPPLAAEPFALGVASGRPMPGSVVLWTRLIAAGEPGEQLSAPIPVDWAIAEDEAMQRIVGRGQAIAEARWAHSVHVEAGGLKPSRPYWYRFTVRGKASPVARTRTAPDASERLAALRFVFASCQQYEQGYYTRLSAIWLRRTLRSSSISATTSTRNPGAASWYAITRADVRRRSTNIATATPSTNPTATYRPRMRPFPWIVTWDDHEVDDDYTDDISPQEPSRERFLAQRAAAYQAFWEHMPLPLSFRPQGPSLRLYDRYRFGDLAEFHVLDDRRYRSHHACRAALPRNKVMRECAERLEPERTMLGAAQETWLADGLARGSTRWNVIAQQTLMAQVDRGEGEHRAFWHDGWDGYAPARQRLLDAVAASPVRDTLVASGDVHSFWAADLKRNFDAANAPTIATEFVGGSITSQGPAPARVKALLAGIPIFATASADVTAMPRWRWRPKRPQSRSAWSIR